MFVLDSSRTFDPQRAKFPFRQKGVEHVDVVSFLSHLLCYDTKPKGVIIKTII
jgi:hypothetical protein